MLLCRQFVKSGLLFGTVRELAWESVQGVRAANLDATVVKLLVAACYGGAAAK